MNLPYRTEPFLPLLRYDQLWVIDYGKYPHNGHQGGTSFSGYGSHSEVTRKGTPYLSYSCPTGDLCLMLFGSPALRIVLDICRLSPYLTKSLPPTKTPPLSTMSMHENYGVTPYLHVSGGDYLLFETWKPVYAGEIFWSCIALIVLSLLDGLISGLRGRFEVYWVSRCGSFTYPGCRYSTRTRGEYEAAPDALPEDQDLFSVELESAGGPNISTIELTPQKRLIVTPFMLTDDLFRGLLYATHALFSYTLMLAAMSVYDCYCSSSRMPH